MRQHHDDDERSRPASLPCVRVSPARFSSPTPARVQGTTVSIAARLGPSRRWPAPRVKGAVSFAARDVRRHLQDP